MVTLDNKDDDDFDDDVDDDFSGSWSNAGRGAPLEGLEVPKKPKKCRNPMADVKDK